MNVNDILGKLVSGELVVVVQQEPTKPTPVKPKLVAEEQELADSLVAIAKKYGKFNEDETGIWAGYEPAKDNVVAHIGVKCSNCALYEGNGVCKIIAQKVEDGGKCRFAVIPDGVVGGVYDPAKTPAIPVSSGKRKIKIKAESESSASCPKATRDIATNLKNRSKAIKTAMYGPLNPGEPNDAYYKKLASEWDVSTEQAKKQTCGNCAMFIVTPEMKSCIESGVTGPKGKDEWEAIDAAGHLGYCEAFDFKCASKRTCRAWVTGGPITETKSVSVRPSIKALGATIAGRSPASAADMIDRDGDGVVLDGTPDEQPVKRKPKRDYERMDNSFLENRRRKFVRSELNRQGVTPTRNDESHIVEGPDGELHVYDGRTDEEVVAREDARAAFSVEEDRKRFVRNQLRKRGMTPTATGADRSSDERQARREARAEYDRRMRAGEPQREQTPTQEEPSRQYPPGYVPGKPADRYPDPGAYVPGKPVDRYPQANIPPRAPQRPPAGSIPPGKGRGAGQWGPATPKPDQGEWDGIVRGRGMQYVASHYPNRPGGANSRVAKDPEWIAEQIKRQRESQSAVDSRNENARRRDEQRAANNADRRELDARTRDFYARGGGRYGNIRNQTAASPVSRARNMSDDSSNEDDRPFRPVPMPTPQARQPKGRMQPRPMPMPRTPLPSGSQRTGRNFSESRDDNEGRLNRDSNGRVTGVDRNRPSPVNPRGPGGGNLIVGEDGSGRGINRPRTAPTPIEPNRPGKDKYDIPDPADEREPGKIKIGRYPKDPNKPGKPGKIEIGRYPRDPNKPRQPGKAIPRNPGTFTPDVQRFSKGQNPRTNPQPRKPMRPGGSDGRYDRNRRTSGGFNQEGR